MGSRWLAIWSMARPSSSSICDFSVNSHSTNCLNASVILSSCLCNDLLTCGAEPFLRSCQLCSHSENSQQVSVMTASINNQFSTSSDYELRANFLLLFFWKWALNMKGNPHSFVSSFCNLESVETQMWIVLLVSGKFLIQFCLGFGLSLILPRRMLRNFL
jgi:hypothetical protein